MNLCIVQKAKRMCEEGRKRKQVVVSDREEEVYMRKVAQKWCIYLHNIKLTGHVSVSKLRCKDFIQMVQFIHQHASQRHHRKDFS